MSGNFIVLTETPESSPTVDEMFRRLREDPVSRILRDYQRMESLWLDPVSRYLRDLEGITALSQSQWLTNSLGLQAADSMLTTQRLMDSLHQGQSVFVDAMRRQLDQHRRAFEALQYHENVIAEHVRELLNRGFRDQLRAREARKQWRAFIRGRGIPRVFKRAKGMLWDVD